MKVNINLTRAVSAALAPLAVAAIATAIEASVSAASPTAGFVAQQRLSDDNGDTAAGPNQVGPNTGPDPNFWNGGDPAGATATGLGPEPQLGSGPGYFNGGNPAGGTGSYTGTDVGSGPGIWNGGESAGAS